MIIGLSAPLLQGDKVSVTLKFEKAGEIAVSFDVQAMGAPAPGPLSNATDRRSMPPPRCEDHMTMLKIKLYAVCLLLMAALPLALKASTDALRMRVSSSISTISGRWPT